MSSRSDKHKKNTFLSGIAFKVKPQASQQSNNQSRATIKFPLLIHLVIFLINWLVDLISDNKNSKIYNLDGYTPKISKASDYLISFSWIMSLISDH